MKLWRGCGDAARERLWRCSHEDSTMEMQPWGSCGDAAMEKLWGCSHGEAALGKQPWGSSRGEAAPERLWVSPSSCHQAMRRGSFHERRKGPRVGAVPAAEGEQHPGAFPESHPEQAQDREKV